MFFIRKILILLFLLVPITGETDVNDPVNDDHDDVDDAGVKLCEHNSDSDNDENVDHDGRRKYSNTDQSSSCLADDDVIPVVSSFEDWGFAENQLLLETFPLDPEKKNFVRQVKNAVFSVVHPVAFKTPVKLVAVSHEVLTDILDLDPVVTSSDFFLAFISGNTFLPGSTPLSHRYGGHQFGSWSGQLGDGRAALLGEYVNRKEERWELQLKGSGLTPYSRRGDGRAVLRSSVREFLVSDAMYHLGIPTTRALSLVVSNDPVMRDQFYDGHPSEERGAVVLRLAPSWFRIGSLEILATNGEIDLLRKLTDFIIEKYFKKGDIDDKNPYLAFFADVVSQTANMIVQWMAVGFTHGVMNTDNFSILSLTIDYGPFGFLDGYIPGFIPNTSDDEGRYSYEKQPDIAYFNLDKLREALLPLLDGNQQKQAMKILMGYTDIYKNRFMDAFRAKLGLLVEEPEDEYLVAVFLQVMQEVEADFTMTFRQLGELPLMQNSDPMVIPGSSWALQQLKTHRMFPHWLKMYRQRLQKNGDNETDEIRMQRTKDVNPKYILRNWMAQQAIEKAEKDDFSQVQSLLQILQRPYDDQPEADEAGYASEPPEWAKKVKVSCSS